MFTFASYSLIKKHMKKLLFILLISLSYNSYSQIMPIDSSTKQITYQGVDTINGKTKLEIYSAIRGWVATAFINSKTVIQMDDKEAGKIICTANIPVSFLNRKSEPYQDAGYVKFVLTLLIKDGKYKFIFNDFIHIWENRTTGNLKYDSSGGKLENEKPDCGTMSLGKSNWDSIKNQTHNTIQIIIKDIHTSSLSISVSNDNF
jgi:hypothetical protein